MEGMFNNHKNIRLSVAVTPHQNGAADQITNMLVTMASTILMYAALICHNDTLYTDFGQWKWTMLYG